MVNAVLAENADTNSPTRLDTALHKTVAEFLAAGYQLDVASFRFLERVSKEDIEDVARKILAYVSQTQPSSRIITENLIKEALSQSQTAPPQPASAMEVEVSDVGKSTFHPLAKDVDAAVEKIRDPTDTISSDASIDSFLRCFRDRFSKLQRIIRQRLDVRDALTVSMVHKAPSNSTVKAIGMISRKGSREDRVTLTLEDLESEVTVIVSPSKPTAWSKAPYLLPDAVVCVVGSKGSNGVIYAEDFLWPDMPNRKPNTARDPVYAILTSDLHIGNRFTQLELLHRFASWLKGERGNGWAREAAGRVKYIIIAGDIVDGIGVYPAQEDELTISDIFKQYEAAADILREIPDYIQIILAPGNHDATRRALPQPAIPLKYAGPLYECREILATGNPAEVSLHGVHVLVHHGRSLEDLLVQLPQASHTRPTEAMLSMLKTRHLAPVYGYKTPLAPEVRDHLVIETPPDIYHTGHIHVYGRQTYRGTLMINSGSWQAQTLYQKKMGVVPTYSIVPVVDLQTLAVHEVNMLDI